MKLFLLVVGVAWIVIGTLLVFVADFARKNICDKLMKSDPKKIGVAPLAVGILLLLSAKASTLPLLIIILGILGVAKGVFLLFGPQGKIKPLIDWCKNANNAIYRILGIATIVLGIVVLMSI